VIECCRQVAAGNPINLDEYGKLTDRLGRAFQRLGLKRTPRDVLTLREELELEGEAEGAVYYRPTLALVMLRVELCQRNPTAHLQAKFLRLKLARQEFCQTQ